MADKSKTTLQFICRGGVFRSRLAEAYVRSKKIEGLSVFSSGVDASMYPKDYASPFGVEVLREAGILDDLTPYRQVTTQAQIDKSDVIVFLDPTVEADAGKRFKLSNQKTYTWDVKDIENYGEVDPAPEQKDDLARISFRHIRGLVDNLLPEIV